MRHIISILLENESGALSRVAGLFSARGYNIESLTVAPTEDPTLSRMTLVTVGSEEIVEQITKQLNKLVDVVKLVDLSEGEHIEREIDDAVRSILRIGVAELQRQLRPGADVAGLPRQPRVADGVETLAWPLVFDFGGGAEPESVEFLVALGDGALVVPGQRDVGPQAVGAGLGGGSSNAAAVLVWLNRRHGHPFSREQLARLGLSEDDQAKAEFREGAGCDMCRQTGFRGRMAVFEYLQVGPAISRMIVERASTAAIDMMARQDGMSSLADDARSKLMAVKTTFREVMKVVA